MTPLSAASSHTSAGTGTVVDVVLLVVAIVAVVVVGGTATCTHAENSDVAVPVRVRGETPSS